ncbi:topoisomerase II-associated protein PAT1 [Gautieria morchelliformis]|nr:topoisomerase II-associated protein PAT1 [Gautieria morchelliformis]
MSFFGLATNHDILEKEKEKFLEGGLSAQEDVAVFNWGESDYDGLGDALQEGGDELNDETFGDGPVGKDFDFSSNHARADTKTEKHKPEPRREYQDSLLHGKPLPSSRAVGGSLESIWDDKSPFSVLPGARAASRLQTVDQAAHMSTTASRSHEDATTIIPVLRSAQPSSSMPSQPSVRTLQEIEAEMRAKQHPQNHVSPPEVAPPVAPSSFPASSMSTRQSPQSSLPLHPSASPLTPDEVEHQLRMMHLTQLQQHQAQRQEQQQPIYQSFPQHRQHYLRTPEQDRQYVLQQQHQHHRSFPPTPEPQLAMQSHSPQIAQAYITRQQQNQLHMQQQLLVQLSQAGVMPDQIHLLDPAQREAIMSEAMRKIMAAERLDQRNRRRLMKMERMARYNDLMTQSDKDFITRIQVSQLVTSDPYTEDFYAQVLGSLRRNGTGMRWFGNAGVGLGVPGHRLGGRREHAMNRMAEQVYRIVENAKAREKEKGQHVGFNPLQGVLGKTSGRSYKAAPRQLLQVDAAPLVGSPTSSPQLHEAEAVRHASEPRSPEEPSRPPLDKLSRSGDFEAAMEPLTRRQALTIIENLFDYALEWENNRRIVPDEGTDAYYRWEADQKALEARMWESSQVTAPLEARYPHPLVSLLSPLKGKKVMKRLTRVMDARQLRITMTLITRLFRDFDVVQNHHVAESLVESKEKHEMEKHIHTFEEFVLEAILPALAVAPLPIVSGQLQQLSDPVVVARTRPGIILLTHIFTRAAIIKDRTILLRSGADIDGTTPDDIATVESFQEWQKYFDRLFEHLAPHFLSLFPSTRAAALLPSGTEHQLQTSLALDAADHPVWSFFASMAVPASLEQQSFLVTQLRDKVLENVLSAHQGWVAESERNAKLRNVNIFLHALGLDSSQISL